MDKRPPRLAGERLRASDCRLTNRTTRGTRLGEALGACLFSFFLGRLSYFAYLCSGRRHGVPPCKNVRPPTPIGGTASRRARKRSLPRQQEARRPAVQGSASLCGRNPCMIVRRGRRTSYNYNPSPLAYDNPFPTPPHPCAIFKRLGDPAPCRPYALPAPYHMARGS